MAHFHIKKKKGRPYLYVREIARVDGKPKVISQIYIGSPERVAGYATGKLQGPVNIKVEEFGALWLAHQVNQEYPPPPPGAVSGGPNSDMQDPVIQELVDECTPQKCFTDHIESWSTNEIIINWNAPLAWVPAFLDERGQTGGSADSNAQQVSTTVLLTTLLAAIIWLIVRAAHRRGIKTGDQP